MIIRSLSAHEALHAIIGKKYGFNCVFVAELNTFFFDENQFRFACNQLQQTYPLLKTKIIQKNNTLFFEATNKFIPVSSITTSSDCVHHHLQSALNNPIDFFLEPPVRLLLIHTEKNTTLVLIFHHLVIDAISGYYLLHQLLTAITKSDFTFTSSGFILSIETYLGLPNEYKSLNEDIQMLNTNHKKTIFTQLQLSYAKFISSIKSELIENYSIHQILTALILHELHHFDKGTTDYRVLHPVDLRKYFANEEKTPAYLISSIDTRIGLSDTDSLDYIAGDLKNKMRKEISEKKYLERIELSPYFIDYYLSQKIQPNNNQPPEFLSSGLKQPVESISCCDNVYVFSQMNHLLTHQKSVGLTYNIYHDQLNLNFHFPMNSHWSIENKKAFFNSIISRYIK